MSMALSVQIDAFAIIVTGWKWLLRRPLLNTFKDWSEIEILHLETNDSEFSVTRLDDL